MKLNNSKDIPSLGFGTFRISDLDVEDAVEYALDVGYRHIDTAAIYDNESGVGKGMKKSRISREDIFLTTKLWLEVQKYNDVIKAFEQSCLKLNTDYIDLYLIHWPTENFLEQWNAMEELYSQGKIKSIGVSNFHQHHLLKLMENSSIIPSVNQIELHPFLSQKELVEFNKNHGIQTESWSPIMKGKVTEVDTIVELAKKYKKSPAQLTLRWHLQRNLVVIPKSANKSRISENFDIFDFIIEDEDMSLINGLNKNQRIGSHPDILAKEKFGL